MADKKANGHSEASDFKRKNKNQNVDDDDVQEEHETRQMQKAQEYIKGMMAEQLAMDRKFPNADRLLETEIESVQKSGKPPIRRYINLYREKPIKVGVKVLVPVREHPRFNFVGKLLGPKGNTMRRLQEETMCKMAVLGRGSMKDRAKEDELRAGQDPKYAHLNEDLHVEINANGPPAEVHARIAFAMAELRKYLIPDSNDTIRQEQMRELMEDAEMNGEGLKKRPVPGHKKVFSILDKARAAMEDTRQGPPQRYEEPAYEPAGYGYQGPQRPQKYAPEAPEYDQEYRREYYREPAPYAAPKQATSPSGRPWKPTPYAASPRGAPEAVPRYRHTPYVRPTK